MKGKIPEFTVAGLLTLAGAGVTAAPVPYTGTFPGDTAGGFQAVTLEIAGERRNALVYRPDGVAHPPLLLMFTGTGGTLEYNLLDEMGRDLLTAFADREGVAIAAPLPRMMPRGDWDNHAAGTPYWETAREEGSGSPVSDDPNGNPDLLLTRALISEAAQRWGIDGGRVYAFGFSNGGFFSYFAAATLSGSIAAFAETGGGLVLDHTTAGEPEPCHPDVAPGEEGAIRSCADAGWRSGTCRSGGAIARPIAPSPARRLPPGFLQANDDDDAVPYAHTCNLAEAMAGQAEVEARVVHRGGGHIVDAGFLDSAWAFLSRHRLPNTPAATDADRIFNVAESLYPELFAPAGAASGVSQGWYYRYYGATDSYVGANGGDAYYLLSGGAPVRAGGVGELLPLAGSMGF